jgi:histidinol phosphatase-like enzyme (inositol monophosphatase family)
MDWTELTNFAVGLARASEAEILPYFRRNAAIDVKPHHSWDPVTEGDRAGERIIRKLIEQRFPDHGINGEEYGIKEGKSGFTWVLDPIDGTRSFVCGIPTWATLIALYAEGKPVIGVMNQPFVGDLFYGNPHGAWNNYRGAIEALSTRRCVAIGEATAGTTAPELYRGNLDQEAFQKLHKAVKLMRYGGDAYFYSVLAAGHLDIALDSGLQAFDIGALIPIIEGAGGAVGSWNGGNPAEGGNVICAGSKTLLEAAIAVMKS